MLLGNKIITNVLPSYLRHLKPLTTLWSASVLVVGMNFLATLLIVSRTSPEVYAAYTVALSVLMLASNWTDAGLASTLNMLATQSGNDRGRLEQHKSVGLRYARRIVSAGFVVSMGLLGVLYFRSQVFQAQGSFLPLAAFVGMGVLTSRTSFWNALLYASGNFGKSSVVQAAPTVTRVILIGAAIAVTGFSFTVLMVVTLLPIVLGWGLARYAWRRTILVMPWAPGRESETETDTRIRQFLKPTMVGTIFNSLSYNITLLGASFFTAGVPIAGYGVFLRLNQIIVMFSGVLIAYVARQLRLASDPVARKQKGISFIVGGLLIYLAYGLVAMTAYRVLGLFVNHYSLDYPLEFAIFLFYNGVGHAVVMLDAVLASFGRADHRLLGSAALGILNTALIPLLRPSSLLTMVVIDTLSILPTLLYYVFVFARVKTKGGDTINLERLVAEGKENLC